LVATSNTPPASGQTPVLPGADVIPKAAAHKIAQEIVVGIYQSPHSEAIKRLAPIFTEITGINVRVEEIPTDAWRPKKLAVWQAHSDEYDVIEEEAQDFLLSGPAGFFEPLDPYLKNPELVNAKAFNLSDWPKGLLDIHSYKGQLYLLPFEVGGYFTFARKDLLADHGVKELPPLDGWSWEKTLDVARTVQESINSKGIKDLWAMAHIFRDRNAGWMYQYMVYGTGFVPWKADLTPILNAPQAVDAMQFLHDLMYKYKVVSPGSIGYKYAEMVELINQGRVVIGLQWNASADINENPEKSKAAGKLTYANFPYFQAAGPKVRRQAPAPDSLGLNPYSKKKEAAVEFLFWYTSPEVARDYATKGGGTSGRNSLLNDPKIIATHPWYPAMFRAIETYFAYPQSPYYPQIIFGQILPPALNAAWTGQLTVKQALDKSQADAIAFLKEKGAIK
jgi:multiple sugar transport system substrate-binding protein